MTTDNILNTQRNIANIERAIRVVQRSKAMTCIKHFVDNTIYFVEIETKETDKVDVKQIKKVIDDVVKKNKQEDAFVQSKKLFLELANSYNDNDIIIKIYDVSECGLKVHYSNTQPVHLIKI
jgi:hypothetical protein